uniref:Uncharacterized protein n=1 Tax=Aureoumbra lagunensis TaxID=44058 RepID=A0A7S3NKQ2_9STRA
MLFALVLLAAEAIDVELGPKLYVTSRQTMIYSDVSPKLRIEGSGFEGDGKNLHMKFVPSIPKDGYAIEVTSKNSVSVILKGKTRWPLADGATASTLYLSSLKDDLNDDPDEEMLKDGAVPVASILGTPTIMRRTDKFIYMTGTRRIFINGTNFRPKTTSFVFDPPLVRDLDYTMEVIDSSVAKLTLKATRRWRSDNVPGPLKIKRLNTGAGELRIDAKFGGVTVAEVQADLGAHGVTVETTDDKRLYQSSPKLTILGHGFNESGINGANTLRWANSLRGKGVNYTITQAHANQLELTLAPNSKWRANPANLPGPLILLAVNAGAGPVPVGATEAKKGRTVAKIYADPTITTSAAAGTKLARTLDHELWIRGDGFVRAQTQLQLRARSPDGKKFKELKPFVDFILVAFNTTHIRVWLQDGKVWADKDDSILECFGIDTGAGPFPGISSTQPIALAQIVKDAEHSSDAAVFRTATSQTLYETPAKKKLTISGEKFCSNTKVVTPEEVEITFDPPTTDYQVRSIDASTIILDLKKKAKWPVGTLKIKALKCTAKQNPVSFAGDDGVAVATILANPTIETHEDLTLYNHHSRRLVIRGSGFSLEGTTIKLEPAADSPPYNVIESLEDYIALELDSFKDDASWIPDDQLAGKTDGLKLKVIEIDTGAGGVIFEKNNVIATVVNEPDGDFCDDSCEWANDGVCDDGTQPYIGDTDDSTPRRPNANRYDDDYGGLYRDDDDDIYGYGEDDYGYYADRGYDDDYGGWLREWDDDTGMNTAACAPGTDCTDCQPRAGDGRLDEPKEEMCSNTCEFARDGYCDDGRDGLPMYCPSGTDCQDCGPVGASNFTKFDDEFWDDDGDNYYFTDDYWDEYEENWKDDDYYYTDDQNNDATNATNTRAKRFGFDDDDAANIQGYVRSQANPFEIDPSVTNNSDSMASLLLAGGFLAILAVAACGALRLANSKPNKPCLPFLSAKSKDEANKDLKASWTEMTNRRDNSAASVPITPDVTYSGSG